MSTETVAVVENVAGEALSVTVIVCVVAVVCVTVGVPPMAPVDVLKVIPAGSDGLIANVFVPYPLLTVGVWLATTVFTA